MPSLPSSTSRLRVSEGSKSGFSGNFLCHPERWMTITYHVIIIGTYRPIQICSRPIQHSPLTQWGPLGSLNCVQNFETIDHFCALPAPSFMAVSISRAEASPDGKNILIYFNGLPLSSSLAASAI